MSENGGVELLGGVIIPTSFAVVGLLFGGPLGMLFGGAIGLALGAAMGGRRPDRPDPTEGTICPACGAATVPSADYCHECGVALDEGGADGTSTKKSSGALHYCYKCGADVDASSDACSNCGRRFV